MEKNRKIVLIVDDDKSILRTFTRNLQKSGLETSVAETGKEAIEMMESKCFDVALVDVRLPDMDGTELLPRMQKNMRNSVKIIITGFPSMENSIKATDAGADAYLVKPVKPEELVSLIEERLKAKEETKVSS